MVLRPDRVLTFEHLLEARVALRAAVDRHHALALLAYVATYALVVAVAIPGATLLTLAGGFLFGTGVAVPCAAFSATAGATALFLAARAILNDFPRGGPADVVARLREGFRRSAWSYMLFLRLTPLVPFWLVNLAAAAAPVPLRTFVWTTAAGILPATAVFASAGANLDTLAAASEAARDACRAAGDAACPVALPWGAILSPAVLVTLTGLSLLAGAPAAVRAWRGRPVRAP